MREVQCLKDKRPCDLSPVMGVCRHNFAWGGKCFDRKLTTRKQIAIDVEAYEAELRAKIHQEIAEEEAKAAEGANPDE